MSFADGGMPLGPSVALLIAELAVTPSWGLVSLFTTPGAKLEELPPPCNARIFADVKDRGTTLTAKYRQGVGRRATTLDKAGASVDRCLLVICVLRLCRCMSNRHTTACTTIGTSAFVATHRLAELLVEAAATSLRLRLTLRTLGSISSSCSSSGSSCCSRGGGCAGASTDGWACTGSC
eukprot:CAMPEP_0115570544 /NCGR_PEP_ID=MMETSP0271-20121206/105757_1 /TAXON_ID=71861 /ORGANISM="Scrippsiella trochoidea, Strain CCMP3099" /LENGTH=178 /DNA_ID=CAMNT_0003005091 /DNA_START=11 /DNA_END=545 /DNA_ORIENTATION=-